MSTVMTDSEIRTRWIKKASDVLLGRTIVAVDYLSKEECDEMDWYSTPVVITLDDGTHIFPVADDEGNDGGALHYSKKGDNNYIIPVI